MKEIIICTIKTWNIEAAITFKKKFINKYHVTIVTDKNKLHKTVTNLNPDYIFFPHWSYFIPKEIYENYNCVVFHMTDLPFGRGGSPLQNLIVQGIKKTKISAIRVTGDLDAGPIYWQEDLDLSGSAEAIFHCAARIIFEKMIPYILENNPRPIKQEGKPVYFKRRKLEDGEIMDSFPIEQIYDYIRMLDAEGYPNAFMKFGKLKLSFKNAQYTNGKINAEVEITEDTDEQENSYDSSTP